MINRRENLKNRLRDLILTYIQNDMSYGELDALIDDDDPIIHDAEMEIIEDLCKKARIVFLGEDYFE